MQQQKGSHASRRIGQEVEQLKNIGEIIIKLL